MNRRILIVDDERSIRQSLKAGLKDQGYSVLTHKKGTGIIDQIKRYSPHLIILDIRLPEVNGIDALEKIIEYDPELLVIMVTAYGDTRTAVETIKKGAYDYIEKPFELDEVLVTIEKAFGTKDLKNEVKLLKKQREDYLGTNKLVAESKEMKKILEKIKVLAEEKVVRVLITGETGVGKGIVARKIHEKSSEKDELPFVEINCGAISPNLIESELFGHEKNAFTGADQLKKGLIEIADGGTVFLDEIGELPLNTQVKILRFLEEKKFKRVGGVKDINVNVRIIAATNKKLEEEVEEGGFRKDLFYRLNVVRLHVPPLRERKKDIVPLSSFFLRHFNKVLGKDVEGLSSEVQEVFKRYTWPGNVRELKNMIERMLIFIHGSTKLKKNHLPEVLLKFERDLPEIKDSDVNSKFIDYDELSNGQFDLENKLEEVETYYIKQALNRAERNKTKASQMLNISRHSLYRKIEKYNIK